VRIHKSWAVPPELELPEAYLLPLLNFLDDDHPSYGSIGRASVGAGSRDSAHDSDVVPSIEKRRRSTGSLSEYRHSFW
jgi:hypothetical protein